ncbi:butyrophilin subfamily 1 member A1-like [Erinaceus europaeus]|uniref:Butyrophilin subfamily 1 member A1-like n=1 Tax=Erinaceus europaeus TaxID=9365 RepID=A0A1S3WK12_ERIEU|nr:butyrophilin subfamily 1 member A1-like [Erinaceus europaeus]
MFVHCSPTEGVQTLVLTKQLSPQDSWSQSSRKRVEGVSSPKACEHLTLYIERSPELRCSPGEFSVQGPGATVIAPVGKEAVLPCHLSPETNVEGMDVTWYRVRPPALVHRYASYLDHLKDQSPEYQGRTEFLKQKITTGQVALSIHPILPSDDGEYWCKFASSTFENEAQFKVLVTDTMFPRLWPWIVGFAVTLCLLAIITTFGVLFAQTRRILGMYEIDISTCPHGLLAEENGLLVDANGQFVEENATLTEQLATITGKLGLENLRRYAEDITLDEDTAHPHLEITENRKYVRTTVEKQDVPDNPQRFDTHMAVLGENSFSAGDHYWEVDVAWKDRWEIGLCEDSVTRKGDISVCPENGFWALSLEKDEYKALSTPTSILNVPEPLLVVGVFLQYEKGLISFYNVRDCSFLCTFKTTFIKPLKPYFYPGHVTTGNMEGLHIPKYQ